MPKEPNKALRVLVPALMMVVGLVIAWAVMQNTSRQGAPVKNASTTTSSVPAAPKTTDAPGLLDKPASEGAATDTAAVPPQTSPAEPAKPVASTPAFSARLYTPEEAGTYAPIGGVNEDQPYVMQIGFSPVGAGIGWLDLRDHYETIKQDKHERLQEFHPRLDSPRLGAAPLAMTGVDIDGQFVNLSAETDKPGSFWKEIGPGEFEATILGEADKPVFRLTRRYRLDPGSYDVVLEQRAENLATAKHTLTWYQFGPADLPFGTVRYGGDKRRVRFGYLASPKIDPSQQYVESKKFLLERAHAMGKPEITPAGRVWPPKTLWPTEITKENNFTLVWAGMTNRYFGVALHPIVDTTPGVPKRKSFDMAAKVDRFVLAGLPGPGPAGAPDNDVLVMHLASVPIGIDAGKSAPLNIGVYAGPLSTRYIGEQAEPRAAAVGLDKIVVYTLGGPCGFCTFQPLTRLLHGLLGFLHDYVFHDWAVGIVFLVFCVRTILHPVTRYSQISLQRFSKQMQALAPKQKAIQEKYKDDPAKMREEMARLMREGHVNYAGALGCLPMFLQTPVWIALYAMLFFTFELHHTPAFYGVFQWLGQTIAGTRWSFMADLSDPDRFIPFGGQPITIPLLSSMMGPIDGINVLPVVLGVVFFIQQKYLTPPPTTALTPEQAQQQKIMKVMMVFMFPLVMYNAPCGLALYFICNSTLGIIESRYIRAHVDKMDLLAPRKKPIVGVGTGTPERKDGRLGKSGGKQPGFFQRLQEQMEAKRKEFERQRGKGPKRRG